MLMKNTKQTLTSLLFLGSFILLTNHTFSQETPLFHVGISEGILANRRIIQAPRAVLETDIQFGVQFAIESGALNVFGVYRLHGNVRSGGLKSLSFASHLLGAGVESRFYKGKPVSILIGLAVLTEVGTNYRDKYIDYGVPVYPNPTYSNSITSEPKYSNHFYYSTPFASNIWIGFDVALFEGVKFSFSLENSIRLTKQRYLEWEEKDLYETSFDELLHAQQVRYVFLDRIGIRLGLSYTFSGQSNQHR